MCALDLPGEHAEDDDLGEPDPSYFGSHPDELEVRPTGFLLRCRAAMFQHTNMVAVIMLLLIMSWNGHNGACPRARSILDSFVRGGRKLWGDTTQNW